ncbi:MAG: class I SAM-dependent methyltransferase [Syntrophales bacterium]
MNEKKFDPNKLKKLNNPNRLKDIPPDYLWDKLNMESADVLVEIGAGTAFFSVALLKYAKPSKVYTCDVSKIMIDWVKENIVPKYPCIIPTKTEEHSIPLDDAIADLIVMINLYHELDDPVLTIGEAYRILKPGGKILIVDWKKQNMTEGPPIQIRCLPEQVIEQLVNSGFNHVKSFNDLAKHFVLTGKKNDQST